MKRAGWLLISCILSCSIAIKALACASILPPYPDKGLFFVTYPEISDKSFVAGNLGIIDPLAAGDSKLLVSYRYMQNEKLTQDEQTAVLKTWRQFGLSNENSTTTPKSYTAAQQQIQKQYQDYLLWRKVRLAAVGQEDSAVPPAPPTEVTKESIALYSLALNNFYTELASKQDRLSAATLASLPQGFNFLTFATQRLQQIEKALAEQTNLTSPEKIALLQKWIAAQQALFAKRDDVKIQPDLSGLSNPTVPLLNADIMYMRAANDLFANNAKQIMQSSNTFKSLATNSAYPWSDWMRYMQYRAISVAANCMAMQCDEYGWCQAKYNEETQKLNQEAMQGMIVLIKSSKDPAVKSAASDYVSILAARFSDIDIRLSATLEKFIDKTSLGNFIYLTRTDNTFNKPDTDKSTFAKMLQSPKNYSDFQQWLTALHVLASNYSPTQSSIPSPYQWNKSSSYNQQTISQIFNLSYQQWKQAKQNHAWLWLSLMAHDGADDQDKLKNVIQAVFKIPSSSPDYFSLRAAVYSATYQQPLQYFKNLKSFDQFIQDTTRNISVQQGFPTQLFWQDKQVAIASSINDLLRNTFILHSNWQIRNGDASLREGGNDLGMYPDNAFSSPNDDGYFVVPRATLTLNELPLNLLVQIAQSPLLSDRFKPAFYVSVWERAYLLQNYALAAQLESTVTELNPTLKPSLDAIDAAKTPDEKRLQFLSLLLHFPRISPVIELRDYADWRPIDYQFTTPMDFKPLIAQPEMFNSIYAHTLWNKNMTFSFSDTCNDCSVERFMNTHQQKDWQTEHQQINQLPDGASWVTEEAISLAKAHPEDHRNAELLALAIQATRFSNSTDDKIHASSKTAFTLLHQFYPKTSWAKKTQYYY